MEILNWQTLKITRFWGHLNIIVLIYGTPDKSVRVIPSLNSFKGAYLKDIFTETILMVFKINLSVHIM